MNLSLEVDIDKIRKYLCMTVSNSDLIPEIALKWTDEEVAEKYLGDLDLCHGAFAINDINFNN